MIATPPGPRHEIEFLGLSPFACMAILDQSWIAATVTATGILYHGTGAPVCKAIDVATSLVLVTYVNLLSDWPTHLVTGVVTCIAYRNRVRCDWRWHVFGVQLPLAACLYAFLH